jgi:hypothetical protein
MRHSASLDLCSPLFTDEYYRAVQQQLFNMASWSDPVLLSASSRGGGIGGGTPDVDAAATRRAAASPLTPLPQRTHKLNTKKRVLYVSMCVGQLGTSFTGCRTLRARELSRASQAQCSLHAAHVPPCLSHVSLLQPSLSPRSYRTSA